MLAAAAAAAAIIPEPGSGQAGQSEMPSWTAVHMADTLCVLLACLRFLICVILLPTDGSNRAGVQLLSLTALPILAVDPSDPWSANGDRPVF